MEIPKSSAAMATNDESIEPPSVEATPADDVLSPLPVPAADDKDDNPTRDLAREQGEKIDSMYVYNPRKPKWWNRLGNNGRDATKSQKRAIRTVLDGAGTTTNAGTAVSTGLRLPPVPYGSKLNWDTVFPDSAKDNRDIWLELGFGRGENLQALLESELSRETRRNDQGRIDGDGESNTESNTDINTSQFFLVGAEVSGVGIGCLCKRIEQLLHPQGSNHCDDDQGYVLYRREMDPYASDPTLGATKDDEGEEKGCSIGGPPPPPRNSSSLASVYCDRLRIHAGDGYKLLPKLPDGSLAAVLVTFPDPFPKEADATYRLVQHQTLIECHRILRKAERRCSSTGTNADSISINTATDNNSHALKRKGRLFLATDHDGYHEWCHRIMHEVNASSSPLFELEQPCPNRMEWLPAVSRYEQKGWDEGRSTKLTCWVAI